MSRVEFGDGLVEAAFEFRLDHLRACDRCAIGQSRRCRDEVALEFREEAERDVTARHETHGKQEAGDSHAHRGVAPLENDGEEALVGPVDESLQHATDAVPHRIGRHQDDADDPFEDAADGRGGPIVGEVGR